MVWEEFLKRYVPDLVRLYTLVWGGRRSGRGSFSSFQGVENEDGASVHEKYVAFSRVKKSKRADKLADKANVKLLDEIGDDLDAVKYAYISQRFQRRHRLGFAHTDSESDDLTDALANKQSFERNESEGNSSPTFGITIGAKLTSSNRKRPKSKKLSHESQERTNKKSGSRTTGFADNMMKGISSKSKFFGAYPADALPIEECGSSDGLARFARKYGYGSWDEDDERKVLRKRRSRKHIVSISSDDVISNTSSKRSTSRRRQTALLSSPGRTRLPMESIEMLNEEFAYLAEDD